MFNMFGIEGIDDKLVNVGEPIQYLSFLDLDKVVGFKSCKETEDKEEFLRIIHENGADITKPFFIEKVVHRMRTSSDVVDGLRVVFTERLDDAWKRSGACSHEAYVFTDDEDLRNELNSLDPHKAKRRVIAEEDDIVDYEGDCC